MLKNVFKDYYEMAIKSPWQWVKKHPIAYAVGTAIIILIGVAMAFAEYWAFTKRLDNVFNFNVEFMKEEEEA